ncbi:MAG TPA: AAA family ATPase, partial [Candidatus Limnocylindria bacterium]|nr:AAA family ATPase [Candidatus Limnocylindria bacterium]
MAVGAVVNTAARLQSLADPGEILVGPACREATAHIATFLNERSLELKGIGRVEAATLAAIASTTSVPQLPFVGRSAELRTLEHAIGRARSGRGTFVVVSGPPGQGKSRLVEEGLGRFGADARILSARCRPGTEIGKLDPLRQLLRSDIGDETLDAIHRRMTELLPPPEVAHAVEVIAHSVGLATSEGLIRLGPIGRRDAFVGAWRSYVTSLARERLTVIWAEDLHWAEPHVVAILDSIARVEAPLCVVTSARPEFLGSAAVRPGAGVIHLDLPGLAPEEALALARNSSVAAARMVDRAEGNPLFIVELARARTIGEDLPMTVQAAISARIDELAPTDRQLLQHAAVVGETFAIRDGALLTDRDAADVAGALARLVHGRYLSRVEDRYRFHHALVRDVAYARLPIADRMHLHARYAREGVDTSDAEALAHHWWEALRPPDAEWVWEPGERAAMRPEAFEAHLTAAAGRADRSSHERALELYERARQLAEGPRELARVEDGLGRAFHRNAQGDEAWDHRNRALEL